MVWKIGIVGGSGFVGSLLAENLAESGEVWVLDLVQPEAMIPNLRFKRCDITNPTEVEQRLKTFDLVINTAIIQIPRINEEQYQAYQVNVLGSENIARVIHTNKNAQGLLTAGTWHVLGEYDLRGVIDEGFGFRPDKVEERARLYALSKIAQEAVLRYYDEMSEKVFGIIRLGTVLGNNMPEKTAANIFIEQAIAGNPITPYSHTLHRPMLYVDERDVCEAFIAYAKAILESRPVIDNAHNNIVNLWHPQNITIMELAETVRTTVIKHAEHHLDPPIRIVDTGKVPLFNPDDKYQMTFDNSRAEKLLSSRQLTSPTESIDRIVRERLSQKLGSRRT